MDIQNENSFTHAVNHGINLFVGAGFSILSEDASGRKLPLGCQLLKELNAEFNRKTPSLQMICTVLEKSHSAEYRQYLKKRFSVKCFPDLYYNLNLMNLKSIYTTNIDNLIPQILQKKEDGFLNNLKDNGESTDSKAINYFPLHGNVDDDSSQFVFDSAALANVYNAVPRAWHYLQHAIEKYPTLFVGYSLNDSSVLQALYSPHDTFGPAQKEKWIVLHNQSQDEKDYFEALGFNIIEADIKELLEKIPSLCIMQRMDIRAKGSKIIKDMFKSNLVPDRNEHQEARPIVSFFRGLQPLWGDITSNNIFKTSYYRTIINAARDLRKNILLIGAPLTGKTTLSMQVAYDIDSFGLKLRFSDLTMTKVEYILKVLGNERALIIVENFTDDAEAFLKLSRAENLKLIGVDRSHDFETVSNYFALDQFTIINVTELSDIDAQGVFNMLPVEVKHENLRREHKNEYRDDTIFEFVIRNIKGENITERYESVIREMERDNAEQAEFLVLCAYMHYCRVPLSMEVAMSFFSDDSQSDYQFVYSIRKQLKDLLSDFEDVDYGKDMDYYYPRSFHFARTIIKKASPRLLAKVMCGVIDRVPQVQICRYNVFKKRAFDKELASRAFPKWQDGMNFYKEAFRYDYDNPYILQQGALYLAGKKQYKLAFDWIDKAKTMTNNRYFSIRNSHAIILFDANCDLPCSANIEKQMDSSMEILHACYMNDQRKAFHAVTFADQAIRYFKKVNSEKTVDYLKQASSWLKEEAEEKNWNRNIKDKLIKINEILSSI